MSDRLGAEIEIGGTISKADVPRLMAAIEADGVGADWGEHNAGSMKLEELVAEDGVLRLMDDEARNGELDSIEAVCRELGLAYVRKSEGKYEYDPEFGITITTTDGARAITSELHDTCEHCGDTQCDCMDGPRDYNVAMDGIECLLLALACNGVDVTAPAFVTAIQTAADACANNFD